jgi:hypothetical protein
MMLGFNVLAFVCFEASMEVVGLVCRVFVNNVVVWGGAGLQIMVDAAHV